MMKRTKADIRKLSMFYPKTKQGLLHDYPELKKIELFRKLSKYELLFVWYMGCESSPFARESNDRVKIENSLIEAYGERKAETMKGAFIAGNYKEDIRHGINIMRNFEIGPRIRAKMMVEKIMGNYEELIDIDTETEFKDKDQEEDWTKKKAYIDSCAKISQTLPTLISQAEGSFGIVEKEDGEEIELNSDDLIDEFHENQE